MQPISSNCGKCGTLIPSRATDGLCPKCLLAEGMTAMSSSADYATLDSSVKLEASDHQSIGERFGEYELLNEIARGGMGVVYRARDCRLNRTVALKMILSGQLASEADIERFQREAEAAAKLDHSGIVPIYEIGEHGGQHFFAMKLIDGGALSDHLAELRDDPMRAVGLLEKVARAVHFAHQRGILHRDLKPANILLETDDAPLVTDLGLAKEIDAQSDLTRSGAVVGTPAYMSPEQAAGKSDVTTATDIYSIGAILYEAITGAPPHKAESPVETLMRVLDGNVTPPREVDRRIDRTLELICMKCLQRDPNQRYASAAALADDLYNWLHGRPVSVRPPSLREAVSAIALTNLRSALGAGLVGIAAGILLAYCYSRTTWNGGIARNPPLAIYSVMQSPVPTARNFAFLAEKEIDFATGAAALFVGTVVMFFVGLIVTLVTRPSPGSDALAIGMVAALLMSITLFALQIGFSMTYTAHGSTRTHVTRLAKMALGNEEQFAEAKKQLFATFPGIENVPVDRRANILAYRIFYDGIYSYPMGMLIGLAVPVLLCFIPCVSGTAFSSKLWDARRPLLRFIAAYVEFMVFVLMLVTAICFQTLLPFFTSVPDGGLIGRWGLQVYVYSSLILMAVVIYRGRLSWRWRVTVYVGLSIISMLIF